jgi:rhombotail lipoprotein
MNIDIPARPLILGLALLIAAVSLSGCEAWSAARCYPNCRSEARASSSLVSFLYPSGDEPPVQNAIPELELPVRVGLAFLPTKTGSATVGLEASHREALLERIRQRFADRKFVKDIVIVPDYYLANARGFEGLQGVQRLYNVDVMALVSFDQVNYRDDNRWSLGYLTIVGAYVLKGTRHDVTTLMDLAVVDSVSRSILLRAGGTDERHGTTTFIDQDRETREAAAASFSKATDQLIGHFDESLAQFEADVRAGKANVRLASRVASSGGGAGGGGGSLDFAWVAFLSSALMLRLMYSRRAAARETGVRRHSRSAR